MLLTSTEAPDQPRSYNMLYHNEIVTTESGAVDIEFYKQEASRIRSEYLLSLFRSGQTFMKNLFGSQKEINESAMDMFKAEKLAS